MYSAATDCARLRRVGDTEASGGIVATRRRGSVPLLDVVHSNYPHLCFVVDFGL